MWNLGGLVVGGVVGEGEGHGQFDPAVARSHWHHTDRGDCRRGSNVSCVMFDIGYFSIFLVFGKPSPC